MAKAKSNGESRRRLDVDDACEQTDEMLSPHEKRYKMLLATIPSSVLLIGPQLEILAANENFLKKAQKREEETLGKRLNDILPPGLVEHINLEEQARRVFATGEPIHGEQMRYRAPGVPLRIYYYSIVPLIWHGDVQEAVLLMEDVTERIRLSEEIRNVERHLASVVESATDIIVSTSRGGKILSWNRAAEKISAYPRETVEGRFFFDLLAPESRQTAKEAFKDIKALGTLAQPEWRLTSKGGGEIEVSWVFSTMKDDSGSIVGVVAVGRDLTERRELESELLRSQKLAALGVMAGGIAHEIRNPLGVCNSAADFLMEDDLSPEFVRECAERIQKGVQRACFIIENLLRFARPSGGGKTERIELQSPLENALLVVANEAKLQKVKFKKAIPSQSIWVKGNENLIQQMFLNLVFNALKAMPDGGELTVRVGKDEGNALVSVADTGCGIPAESLDKIFDPFYTTRPVGEGTGLGLSLAYSIAKQHSGDIEVESVEGKGATFTVRLPVCAE